MHLHLLHSWERSALLRGKRVLKLHECMWWSAEPKFSIWLYVFLFCYVVVCNRGFLGISLNRWLGDSFLGKRK